MSNGLTQGQLDPVVLVHWFTSQTPADRQVIVAFKAKGREFIEKALAISDQHLDLLASMMANVSKELVDNSAVVAREAGSEGNATNSAARRSDGSARPGYMRRRRRSSIQKRWPVDECKNVFKLMLRANDKQLANISEFCLHISKAVSGSRTAAAIQAQYTQHFAVLAGLVQGEQVPNTVKDYAVLAFRLAKEEVAYEDAQQKAMQRKLPGAPLPAFLALDAQGQPGLAVHGKDV